MDEEDRSSRTKDIKKFKKNERHWKKLMREEIGVLVSKMLLTQSKMKPRTSHMVYSYSQSAYH